MKFLRHILLAALFTIGVFGSVVYVGCKNKCGSITCNNGGTCVSNVCVCPTGYYGNSCQTAYISDLLGSYNCTRSNCTSYVGGTNTWQSVITTAASNGGYTFVISNFNNSNTSLTCEADSLGNINTNLANGESGMVAKGKFVAPLMTLRYYVFSQASGIVGAECTMTMTKL